MLVIGLTGGIGSGKTTVANIFSELSVPVVDTDIIARELVKPGQPALSRIIEYFGKHIVNENGELDRQKLSEITFNNRKERKALESILHPDIERKMLNELNKIEAPYCIAVIPLLYETGQQKLVDRTLVVDCDTKKQLQRVLNRDNRTREQILSIIDLQISRQARLDLADDIIENSTDRLNLHDQVVALHRKYMELGA